MCTSGVLAGLFSRSYRRRRRRRRPSSPETVAAYLGSQGDPWDTQKDMLMDWMGAVAGVLAFSRLHNRAMALLP